jgi:hypothetical protein
MKVEDKNIMNLKLSNTYKPAPKEEKPATPQEEGMVSENEKESKKRQREDPKLAEQRKSKKKQILTKEMKTYVSENRPNARFADFGGIDTILDEINDLIIKPFSHPGKEFKC